MESRLEDWFAQRGWKPFEFQRATWEAYLAGRSGLVHAPTGVGKTYAVWLGPVIEALGNAPDSSGSAAPFRVLWLTPLRALAGDTALALQVPLEALGLPWTVEVRTGDTPAARKRKQRERLPTALVTTPESLTLLLSHPETREQMSGLRCVVVDEWHELIGTKRGVQTELALARLRSWLPELRTWGLSATLGNLETARDVLLGGAGTAGAKGGDAGALIHARQDKRIELHVLIPDSIERLPWSGHLGGRLAAQVSRALDDAPSTLLFTNTRWQAETWFRMLLEQRPELLGRIGLHHGSLDRALRARVEERLRDGRLRAVVCTSSLDLGVDFAPVEQVVQIGSPKGVARLLQRAGRSGHRPGAISRILCVPTHAFELVEFAAVRDGIEARCVEERVPLESPLDVLAQHVVTIAAGGGFRSEELLAEVRTTRAYRDLTDEGWRWTLDFVERGGPSLAAYPRFARIMRVGERHAVASAVLARTHRMNIGTITGEASLQVRSLNGRKLGTIEEYFVSRLSPGDVFVFTGRTLEFVRMRGMDVFVRPARVRKGVIPRWSGGRFPLSTQLGSLVRARLATFESEGASDEPPELAAARPLLDLQRRWSRVPRAGQVLIERIVTREGAHWFVYPFEGRLVHEGLAALIAMRLTRDRPLTLHLTASDYGFELLGEADLEIPGEQWRRALAPEGLVDDLLACVHGTQIARRQFRDIARVAGLVLSSFPGAPSSGRQLQASSDMFFDVFQDFDPNNLLLDQARREVLVQQLEFGRLRAALERISISELVFERPAQLTPLAFPLYAETLRTQHVSSEKWSERVRKLAVRLERSADGRRAARTPRARQTRTSVRARQSEPRM